MLISGIISTSGVCSEAVRQWNAHMRQIITDMVDFDDVIIGA